MKKILIILSILILSLLLFLACQESPEDMLVGTWNADDPDNDMGFTKIEINDDGTFKAYGMVGEEGSETEEEVTNGTIEAVEDILHINIEQEYDDDTGELADIGEGDYEKMEMTFVLTETKLAIPVYLGGDKDTLIGTWTMEMTMYEFGVTEPETGTMTMELNEDGTYSMDMGSSEMTGSEWTYENDQLTITYDDGMGGTMDMVFDISFVGDGLVLEMEGEDAFSTVLTKAAE